MRKLSVLCALVLVIASVLVVPVQAEPPETTFIATTVSMSPFVSDCRFTGGAQHCTNSFNEVVDAPDERFRGTLYSVAVCNGPGEDHPQAVYLPDWDLIIGWGPCDGVWRLEVTADSGWEGQFPGLPQADYRNGKLGMGTGQGYGEFKGMTVKWLQNDLLEWGVLRYVTIKQDK